MATAVVNGIRMHYGRIGEGSPIVLLHGWPQTGYAWRHVAADLAADNTVIVPDLRGYGRSDKPAGGMDKRTMAADLSALLVELGFERANVAGHDRGGRVAHATGTPSPRMRSTSTSAPSPGQERCGAASTTTAPT
jgi:pimeloyl-ACP methyl ester carboxylesterase